jgi:hypothetical protein
MAEDVRSKGDQLADLLLLSTDTLQTRIRELVAAADATSPAAKKEAFRLEWYKLHRAHELELNKATLAYEHERLKFLSYLNGGAAGVFLTLVGSSWRDSPPLSPYTIVGIACWIVGLLLAWSAWTVALTAQSNFTKAYRMRRYGEELLRMGEPDANTNYDFGIQLSHPDNQSSDKKFASAADAWRTDAGNKTKNANHLTIASVALFAAGAVFATLGVASAKLPSPTTGQSPAAQPNRMEAPSSVKSAPSTMGRPAAGQPERTDASRRDSAPQ